MARRGDQTRPEPLGVIHRGERTRDLELATIAGPRVHVPQLQGAGHSGGRCHGRLRSVRRWLDDAPDASDLADPAHESSSVPVPIAAVITDSLVPRPGCWLADPSTGPAGQ